VVYSYRAYECSQITIAANAGIIDVDDIEVWELEEFLEDILNAEFNLVCGADNDGSDLSLVSVYIFCIFKTNVVYIGRYLEFLNE